MGKMISLQTIAVAAAATGMSTADQSRLFRFTLKHSIFLASVVGGWHSFASMCCKSNDQSYPLEILVKNR